MRRIILNTVSFTGNVFSLKALIKLTQKRSIFLLYHTVNDIPPPHIKHLYRPRTAKEFITDIDYLSRHFRFVSTFELAHENSKEGRPLLHLSFDDGLKECYDIIRPLLLQKGIPATFFINPAFVDNKKMFHCHKASLLKAAFKKNSNLLYDNNNLPISTNEFQKEITSIKGFSEEYYNSLALQLGVNFEEYLQQNKPYLNLQQIKAMQANGFEFGGHTLTHPLLINLSEKLQQTEILDSIQWLLENEITNSNYFAFPFNDIGIGGELFTKINTAGILQTFGTSDMKEDSFANHHHRISFEDSNNKAVVLLKQALFKYFLLKVIGKNKIVRN